MIIFGLIFFACFIGLVGYFTISNDIKNFQYEKALIEFARTKHIDIERAGLTLEIIRWNRWVMQVKDFKMNGIFSLFVPNEVMELQLLK